MIGIIVLFTMAVEIDHVFYVLRMYCFILIVSGVSYYVNKALLLGCFSPIGG